MKRNDQCPSSEELITLYCDGADQNLIDHISSCERCALEWKKIEALVQAGRKSEIEEPSEERIDQMRRNVLGSMNTRNNPDRRWLSAVAASAALVVVSIAAWAMIGLFTSDEYKATVVSAGQNASYRFVSAQPDELLVLEHGRITLDVKPLTSGERFRVAVGDSFVEVRGTVFDVSAEHKKLVDVRVISGKVEVKTPEAPKVSLIAGRSWTYSKPTAMPVVSGSEPVVEPVEIASVDQHQIQSETKHPKISKKKMRRKIQPRPIKPQPDVPSPTASALKSQLDEGLRLIKSGRYDQAAEVFGRAQKEEGNRALVEEAAYWQGLSLQRAGRISQAESTFKSYLARFPASPRRGEVAVALGWILFNRGENGKARSYFAMAAQDSSEKVSSSARRGLDAIGGDPDVR